MKIEMVMGDALRRNAFKYPLKIALRDSERQITYGELNDRVNRLANGLLRKGIRKGDPVALLVGNRIEHLEIVFALAKIGALGIPLDIKWRALEIASTLSSFQAVALFLEDTCQEEYSRAKEQKSLEAIQPIVLGSENYDALVRGPNSEEPAVEVEEDSPFLVMITSGTTSFPKGCLV
ncbi:MAG: class I adenylate-forming enzyme family protein, partial [Deltaproteobacteria bacterium]|nr:class I adenylate-forming enzyme family protein [Deltaproteobacteria bacterium]